MWISTHHSTLRHIKRYILRRRVRLMPNSPTTSSGMARAAPQTGNPAAVCSVCPDGVPV